MELLGTYGGVVESVHDPLKLGRLKVRVPLVYGLSGGTSGYIGTNDIPWAMPAGMPAGGSARSGGFSHLPDVGDKVWVRFLDGEPEKPLWEWGMQSRPDAESLKLHSYKNNGGKVGDPDRAVWMRYGHAVELNEGGIIVTTSQGYRLLLNDASKAGANDGSLKLSTAKGQYLEIDDATASATQYTEEDYSAMIGGDFSAMAQSAKWETMTDDFTVISGRGIKFQSISDFNVNAVAAINLASLTEINLIAPVVNISPETLALSASVNFTVTSPVTRLNSSIVFLGGYTATEPFVKGSQFAAWAESLIIWLNAHVHAPSEYGFSTSPPLAPVVTSPEIDMTLSQKVFGT